MADIDNVVQPEVDTTQTQTVDTTVTPTATEKHTVCSTGI